MGAGPGDAELLTLKAARVLGSAELVLYDHLVSDAVLAHIAPGAERIYVGKQSRNHTLPQEGIIELMVRLARQGRSLVRLKGGDPFVFGRGGEEAEGLACGYRLRNHSGHQRGPGRRRSHRHTAYAPGNRRHAGLRHGAPAGCTGRPYGAARLGGACAPRQTVVIYMGVGTLPVVCEQLVAHGLPESTPAALVERATLPEQRCIVGTVATLPALGVRYGVKPPALIMIGEAVGRQVVPPGGAGMVSSNF